MSSHEWDWRQKTLFRPPAVKRGDVRALAALFTYAQTGESAPSPAEMQQALDWILKQACGIDKDPYWPGDMYNTAYMSGRRSVGIAIVSTARLKPENVEE